MSIGNITRRVLGLIRDEVEEDRNGDISDDVSEVPEEESTSPPELPMPRTVLSRRDSVPDSQSSGSRPSRPPALTSFSSFQVSKSLMHLLSAQTDLESALRSSGTSTPVGHMNAAKIHALKAELVDAIGELLDEIRQVDEQIAAQAEVQIHPGDTVLVYLPSRRVTKFILKAAARRKFTVFIVGERPGKVTSEDRYAGFREKLQTLGCTVINIMGSGMMAYMSTANKVILSARAVASNGVAVVDAGAGIIARAAHAQGKAVVVLIGIYGLTPEPILDEDSVIEWGNSATYVDYDNGGMVNGVDVRSALTEIVSSNLIDTYITNV
jgi:translation initiation factor eIF-2B subunit beta